MKNKTEADFASLSCNPSNPCQLDEARIAIWGVGLMGGSLAMALCGKVEALYGIDPDPMVCRQAEDLQIFDDISSSPGEILPQANIVVLSAPLGIIPQLLQELPKLHPGSAIVLDIGSTKTGILDSMQQLPERFVPLGGHPMCGKEVNTLSHACTNLYQETSFALLPLPRTSQTALNLIQQLVHTIGAYPVILDSSRHDQWVASISHLPYLIANCLSSVTPLEASPLVGPGYTSTTRLAEESLDMMLDILINNRSNVFTALKDFHTQIDKIEKQLETGDFDSLRTTLSSGLNQHIAVMDSFQKGKRK